MQKNLSPIKDIRPLVINRRVMPIYCQAMSKSGKPCKCHALRGEAFCNSHLRQGYGLFTLAALSERTVTIRHD